MVHYRTNIHSLIVTIGRPTVTTDEHNRLFDFSLNR